MQTIHPQPPAVHFGAGKSNRFLMGMLTGSLISAFTPAITGCVSRGLDELRPAATATMQPPNSNLPAFRNECFNAPSALDVTTLDRHQAQVELYRTACRFLELELSVADRVNAQLAGEFQAAAREGKSPRQNDYRITQQPNRTDSTYARKAGEIIDGRSAYYNALTSLSNMTSRMQTMDVNSLKPEDRSFLDLIGLAPLRLLKDTEAVPLEQTRPNRRFSQALAESRTHNPEHKALLDRLNALMAKVSERR